MSTSQDPSPIQLSPPIRSDANEMESSIVDNVLLALRNAGYIQLQNLKVKVDGRVLCLQGQLPSYYLKQIAQHIAQKVAGDFTLIDEIDIAD